MPQTEKTPILIVDDRRENLTALEALLAPLGLDIAKALSGNEALRCTLRTDFALVLLDVQMPDMDGYETAELMRKNPKTRHLPIIFFTAGMKEDLSRFRGYESGAVDYLIKPIEPAVLQSKVRVFCDLFRQRRELEAQERALEDLVERRTESLRSSESRLRSVTDFAPGSILQLDREGRLLFSNRPGGDGAWDLAVGSNWIDQVPAVHKAEIIDNLDQVLLTGKGEEFEIKGPTGSRWYRCRMNRVEDSPGLESCILFLTDITHQKDGEELRHRMEAEITRAQKMESLGSLASGVAHDMNNVLAAILTMTQMLQVKRGSDEVLAKDLSTIEKAVLRGRSLVKGLTNFVRKDLDEASPLDLNGLVKQEMELLSRTTLQKIELKVDLQEPLPLVWGDAGSLGSALMNICVNAVDAMPQGGALHLRTRSAQDSMVELSVEDTGSGMAAGVLERAMEPFFTTKPFGKGTGLGLSMVYATLKAHGGDVRIQSVQGRGTTLTLRLPIHEALLAPVSVPQVGTPLVGSPCRILLVDDDELIRESVPGMLETMGHEVLIAPGGKEALLMLQAGAKVDLVILDLNMPGMNGAEAFQKLRAAWPSLPVIMATGFLDPETAFLLDQGRGARSIAKPFNIKELGALIQGMGLPTRA
jgi:signal transduction histidine kinase